jgi:hypothetical protein
MPHAMIYVFREPRNWKNKPAESFSFMYADREELEVKLMVSIEAGDIYHITAFNAYGQMLAEVYKSQTTKGKVK